MSDAGGTDMTILPRDIGESLRMALYTLGANKLRSFLTTLGVIIGVMTVIGMVSIIQGLNRSFTDQIESLGSNTIFISKFDPTLNRRRTEEEKQRKELTYDDAMAIESGSPSIAAVSPEKRKAPVTVVYENRSTDSPELQGVIPSYEQTRVAYNSEGRFITTADADHHSNICVIGSDVVEALFPYEDPLGKEIRVEGQTFQVVGIREKQGSFFGQSRDNIVLIPFTTFQKYYPDDNAPGVYFVIIVRPRGHSDVQMAVEEMTETLRRRRQLKVGQKNNFGISTQDSLIDIYNQLTGATEIVLTVISGIALAIGGIGVMNIMLVSVTERTREIGIRKAIGARRKDIMRQFLFEAMALTGVGGAIGIASGALISFLVNRYSTLPAYVPLWAVGMGLGVSVMIGLFFGLYPAFKASSLDPIIALHYE